MSLSTSLPSYSLSFSLSLSFASLYPTMSSLANTSPLPLPAIKPPSSYYYPVRYSSLPKLFSKHPSLDRDQDRPQFWLYDSLRLLTMSIDNSLFDVIVPAEWSLMEHYLLSWHSALVGYLNQPLSRPIAGTSIGVLLISTSYSTHSPLLSLFLCSSDPI